MTKVDCFKAGTCTAKSMARLRNILNEDNDVKNYVARKFARLEGQFNPEAMKNNDSDDSYAGEEPGMHPDVTVCEADNVIANTGINPIMFEEGIDTSLRNEVQHLHSMAHGFKDTPKVSKEEMDKRDEVESDKNENPHYVLMEVKHKRDTDGGEMENKRKFYRNGTEGYETTELNMDCPWYAEETGEDDWKNQEKQEYKRKCKVAVQLLYKKLKESKAGMKLAAQQKKRSLYEDFKKEYNYCSKNLDALKECDEKIKQNKIKRRKDILRTKLIMLNNLGSKVTVEKIKRIINEKSLAYAEKVVDSELAKYKRS